MQTVTYGASHDGDCDLVALGEAGAVLFVSVLGNYVVDFVPWRELYCMPNSRSFD